MEPKKEVELFERLSNVEVLLTNHLKHHETLVKFFVAPIVTGSFLGIIVLLITTFFGGK